MKGGGGGGGEKAFLCPFGKKWGGVLLGWVWGGGGGVHSPLLYHAGGGVSPERPFSYINDLRWRGVFGLGGKGRVCAFCGIRGHS